MSDEKDPPKKKVIFIPPAVAVSKRKGRVTKTGGGAASGRKAGIRKDGATSSKGEDASEEFAPDLQDREERGPTA